MSIVRTLATTACSTYLIFSASVQADVVTDWNQTAVRALEAAALPPPPQSRILAMVHAAMYDAVNSIDRRHAPYSVDIKRSSTASIDASAAAAAHGVLLHLFPGQQVAFDKALNASLAALADGEAKQQGMSIGQEVAARMIEMRKNDGATSKVGYEFKSGPGNYQKTPPMNMSPVAPQWRNIKPFVLTSASQFAPPGPPNYKTAAFQRDFDEVKSLGSRYSNKRTNEQTAIALYWAGSEVPPLNAVARSMATAKKLDVVASARLFAYLNLAIADSFIAGFDAKYKFNAWRPITAIRSADATGNKALMKETNWEPLMVTPPHPEYPSAHCFATGAAVQVLEGFLGTDKVAVSLVQPPLGYLRHYSSLPELVKEMEDARVWGGIHFRSADEHGTALGRKIGEYVLRNSLQPNQKQASLH